MKVGVIGVGSMGRNHARVLASLGALHGVYDVVEAARQEVASKHGVKPFSSPAHLLRECDAVVVATPTRYHRDVAAKVIEAGKHLLVEKPLGTTAEEAWEIVQMARDAGVTLAVGHVERYNPAVEFVKNYAGGRRVISMVSRRVSAYPWRIRDVGVVMDLGVHDIDVMRYIGGEVVSVYATGGRIKNERYEDYAAISLDFKDGKVGFVEVNWLTPKKIRKMFLTCEDSYVEMDYMEQRVDISRSEIPHEQYDLYNLEMEVETRSIRLRREEPLKRELMDFMGAIEERRDPLVRGEDGARAVEIAEAALRSMETGQRVELE